MEIPLIVRPLPPFTGSSQLPSSVGEVRSETAREIATPRERRVKVAAVVVILAAALVATLAFMLVRGSRDGSDAIDLVKEASSPALERYRASAQRQGDSVEVTWSARPMSGGQMVEVRVVTSVPPYGGRAVFMVTGGRDIVPQDGYAASLLGPGVAPRPHQ